MWGSSPRLVSRERERDSNIKAPVYCSCSGVPDPLSVSLDRLIGRLEGKCGEEGLNDFVGSLPLYCGYVYNSLTRCCVVSFGMLVINVFSVGLVFASVQ